MAAVRTSMAALALLCAGAREPRITVGPGGAWIELPAGENRLHVGPHGDTWLEYGRGRDGRTGIWPERRETWEAELPPWDDGGGEDE
jgi:hypothetical protein